MALTLATELANYAAGIGTQGATLKIDSANKRVGVGTTNPQGPEGSLQVGTGITFFGNTGIISAIGGKFSGDFTVGGTLTYEDVQNVNSSGVGTFSGGINVVGGGLTVTGVSTFFSRVSIADSIVHTGDINTSLRFPAADTFTVETAGAERFRIIGVGGSIGINETTPDSKVDIVHSTAENSSTENLIHLRTDPSGSYVTRGLFVKIGRDGAYDNSAARYDIVGSSGNSGFHAFEVQGNEKLRITKDGGVLIGGHTTAVDSGNAPNIEIVNTSTSTLTLARNDTSIASGNDIAAIRVWGNDSNGTYQQCAEILAEADGDHGTGDKPTALAFKVTADGASSPTERLRITSAGLVGIGTENPTGNLEINAASTTDMIRLHVAGINFAKLGHNSASGTDILDVRSEGHTRFLTNGNNERVRINSAGRVGIATVLPEAQLTVKGDGDIGAKDFKYLYSNTHGIQVKGNEAAIDIVGTDSGSHGSSLLLRSSLDGFGMHFNPTKDQLIFNYTVPSADDFSIHDGNNTSTNTEVLIVGKTGICTATQLFEGSSRVATAGKAVAMALVFG